MSGSQIRREQATCLSLQRQGRSREEICKETGLNIHMVKRRLSGARKADRLDPELVQRLASQGISDLAGLHSGWLLEKDTSGSGSSLYFYLGPDEEKINFAEAMRDVLSEIPRLEPIPSPAPRWGTENFANWLFLADLHLGSDYGDPALEEDFNRAIDSLVLRMPPARHAVLFELGDLLDANDHKGVTPASGNPCDVRRDQFLATTRMAVRLMKRALYRLLENHETVEAHLVKGNHDPTAYIAVLLALSEHFANNPRITIYIPSNEFEEEYRVVTWGLCACFPNHGDKAKWSVLKSVWTDMFPDAWAQAKAFRLIATGHFHSEKRADLGGAIAEQFGTLYKPNRWAREQGFFARGSLCAITVHRDRGEEHRTISSIRSPVTTEK